MKKVSISKDKPARARITVNPQTGKYWDEPLTLVGGCTAISPGCQNCWSATLADKRLNHPNEKIRSQYEGLVNCGHFTGKIRLFEERLRIPLKTEKPTVFNVWNDLFHPDVPKWFIDEALEIFSTCPQHLFIALTKRADGIGQKLYGLREDAPLRYFGSVDYLPNLLLGVSIEHTHYENRFDELIKIPAAGYVLSLEPMIGPISLRGMFTRWAFHKGAENGDKAVFKCRVCGRFSTDSEEDCPSVEIGGERRNPLCEEQWMKKLKKTWVIAGGETGSNAARAHPDWFRTLRDECAQYGVPFLLKSLGEWAEVENGKILLGDVRITRKGFLSGGEYIFDAEGAHMRRVGKQIVGRTLDGKRWDETPEINPAFKTAKVGYRSETKSDSLKMGSE